MAQGTKVITKRKKFFDVEIPLIQTEIELVGDTIEQLNGKTIKLDLTRQLRGKSVEAVFKVKTEKNSDNIYQLRLRKGLSWGMGNPSWMSDKRDMKRITTTHKANLFKKEPESYPQFIKALSSKHNKPCCDRCQYYWVTHVKEIS